MPAEILPTDTPELYVRAVERASELLGAGEVVGLPTETVYGLAANALDSIAVGRIYEIKGRPPQNPIIVHVASLAMAQRCVSSWPEIAQKLAASFWPGPLTLVLPKSPAIPSIVTACGTTIGIRWPSHPLIQAVIRACDFPLAAPSANPSNEISPTTAEHVQKSLGARVPLIVDGGPSNVGIESTVLDLTTQPPRVLRPGIIHQESILAVTGELSATGPNLGPLKSPGLLPKHYSPKAEVRLCSWASESELRERLSNYDLSKVHVIAHGRIPLSLGSAHVTIIPHDPEAFARAIYAELHRCDDEGAQMIVIEEIPDTAAWHGIADRLRRAAVQ
jgi:L-threonylcarbamoyladenylate synthase